MAVWVIRALLGGKRDASLEVEQPHASLLRRMVWIAGLLIGVFALYVMYELGRYDAGYDRQAVAQQRTELEVKIEQLEQTNREMRTQIAESDAIRIGRSHEQAEVAREMGELQGLVARQSQELAFYRGLVAQNTVTLGVRVEQLHIVQGPAPATYVVKLALVRSGRTDTDASGTVHLSLNGTTADGPKTLDLGALTGGRVKELRYGFKYLQNLEQPLAVPLAFEPQQLSVELASTRQNVPPLSQSFRWTVESAP